MQVLRDYKAVPPTLRGAAVAVGNFDGVHRGHQALIARTGSIAQGLNCPLAVLTFEPHPRSVFNPDVPPFRLTPFRSKARLLSRIGVEIMYCLRFNKALFSKPAESFVRDVLVNGLAVRHVVVGYDFVFGHKRSGDAELLNLLGQEHGFGVTILEPVTHNDDVCSSTIIRVNLETGRARRAAELLGHWWEIEGHVRAGDRRGRLLGFPTANVHLNRRALQPALGVYAVYVGVPRGGDTVWHKAVANLGRRPTFEGRRIVLEAHLFDFSGDLYGRQVRVAFVEHLRPETKFAGIEQLKTQIAADCDRAREILARPESALDALRPLLAPHP